MKGEKLKMEVLYEELAESQEKLKAFSLANSKVLETYGRLQEAVDTKAADLKDTLKVETVFIGDTKTVRWNGWEVQRKLKAQALPKERTDLFLDDLHRAGLINSPSIKDVMEAIRRGTLPSSVIEGYDPPVPDYIYSVTAPKKQ